MNKVKDLMKPLQNYEIVNKNDYFQEIINIFLEDVENRNFKILAVKEDDKIIGILSIGDILRTLKKLTRTYRKHEIFKSTDLSAYGSRNLKENTEKDLEVGFSLKVKEIMKTNRRKVNIDDSGISALDLLLENNLRILPVYNGQEIVGIIRDIDLLECIVGIWKEGR